MKYITNFEFESWHAAKDSLKIILHLYATTT